MNTLLKKKLNVIFAGLLIPLRLLCGGNEARKANIDVKDQCCDAMFPIKSLR